jgi:ribosomal protein S18 acetylase RimI-like enzyme
MAVDYRTGNSALTTDAFSKLAHRIWPRDYDPTMTGKALEQTINIGAWDGDRLIGSVRILSDGYFFSVVAEIMVDPDYRRQGIGKELLRRALEATPGGTLFVAAQPGQDRFVEAAGFRRGPNGFVGRRHV